MAYQLRLIDAATRHMNDIIENTSLYKTGSKENAKILAAYIAQEIISWMDENGYINYGSKP